MFWILTNGGPVGFDPQTFSGPALTVIAISQYAVPLAVAELYFRARRRSEAAGQFAVAALLTVLTVMMSIGIFGAIAGLWLPRMGVVG